MVKKRSNLKFMLKEWLTIGKNSFIQTLIRVPVELMLPTLMALVPKLIIDAINDGVTDNTMLFLIGGLTFFLVLLSVIQPYFWGKMSKADFQFMLHFSIMGIKKMLNVNYQKLETFEGRRRYERARAFCGMSDKANITAGAFIWIFGDIFISFCGIFSYIILFSVLQPYLVIILIFSSVIEFFIIKRLNIEEVKAQDDRSSVYTKLFYFYRVATESKSGKDIRLYGLSDWFCMSLAKLMAGMATIYNKLFKKKVKFTFGQMLAIMLRDIASYGFLIYFAVTDKMALSNFILYFGLLVGFSGWITGLAENINFMKKLDIECGRFREFMDEADDVSDAPMPFVGAVENIEFCDVCFAYENSEELTLKNINFKIGINDRVAIVGENGAGKTTLIKLMCGLYKPTSGKIMINGTEITENIGKKYFELFATVFQDFYFLPLTLLENITMSTEDKSDENRAKECLKKAGLLDKINSLPEGLKSKMVRQVWEGAVEFSGGEQQRFLLARALYKDAPILILDEPTSALDPLAEQKIYSGYREYSIDKISIFISHRLASTQFCSQVFYMSNGEITERGSHEELLGLKGRYWSMFEAQSFYYNQTANDLGGGENE